MSNKPIMLSYPEYKLYDKVYVTLDPNPWWVVGFEPVFVYDELLNWNYHLARPMYKHEYCPPERWTCRMNMSTLTARPDEVMGEQVRIAKAKEKLRLKIADAQAELDRLRALEAASVYTGEG